VGLTSDFVPDCHFKLCNSNFDTAFFAGCTKFCIEKGFFHNFNGLRQ